MQEKAFEQIEELKNEIESMSLDTEQSIEAFRIKYLGSKNCIKPLFGLMKSVEPANKKNFGLALNDLKESAQVKFEQSKAARSNQSDSVRFDGDLTLSGAPIPTGSIHPIEITNRKIIDIFKRIGFVVADDREIEDDWHNFTAMNTPEDHPARDMQDTFYIQGNLKRMLRSQTSSVQARVMGRQKPPIRIIAPGRVYRNETISARSHCQFHQVEGLYIDENVSFADMKQTLLYYAQEMYGEDVKIRLRPSYFPFTEPSAEMDVYWGLENEVDHKITKGTGWLEVLGCGMVDPAVLENCGIDSEKYTGFAFGMGIERQAMFTYRIPDIRMLFENDIRFLKQFSHTL